MLSSPANKCLIFLCNFNCNNNYFLNKLLETQKLHNFPMLPINLAPVTTYNDRASSKNHMRKEKNHSCQNLFSGEPCEKSLSNWGYPLLSSQLAAIITKCVHSIKKTNNNCLAHIQFSPTNLVLPSWFFSLCGSAALGHHFELSENHFAFFGRGKLEL